MTNPQIYILGDIHGSFKPIRSLYNNISTVQQSQNVLILLGDAGFNFFFNYRDENFKAKVGKYPFTYFVIRGNHEQRPSICMSQNPEDWHTEEFFGNTVYVENKYPYIKYALDEVAIYQIPVEYQTLRTLIIPGAYSVDKYKRLRLGWSWFEQEQLSQEEMDAGKRLIKQAPAFDLVLSHTCPIMYEPTDLFLSCVNQSTVEKNMEQYLGEIEFMINYKLWLFGHYHQHRAYPPNQDNARIIMLFNQITLQLNDYFTCDTLQFLNID